GQTAAPQILAEMAEQPATRTCIDSDALVAGENTAVLWMPGDQLGVFTSGSSNVLYTNDEQTENIPNASFSSDAAVSGDVQYAYYPYDAANDGKAATALTGTVPAEQTMGQNIPADYKFGQLKAVTAEGGYKFKFRNMFSLVRFKIDATGTALEGKTLESVTMTVTRDGAAVPVTGDFTFSAVDGTYAEGTTSNELKTVWNQTLDGAVSSFATVFPEVQSGDKLTFIFKAGELAATLTVTSKADFAPEMYYTFPLTLANFSGLKVEKMITGTFKAATYNVKSSTNGSIGTKITESGWDFFSLSEDFSNLKNNLSTYTFGTRSRSTTSLWGSAPKDGLGFATRNGKCSFSGEYVDEFDEAYGGLFDGANTVVDKGFRYYLVTMSDGVQIDVIITHMNTYDTENHWNCQHNQLKEIATWIKNNCGARPVIFMGDTNLRYTRHDFETFFWSVIRKDGLTYNDPWVDYQWAGVYPTYPSKSLMVSDATGTNSETDIICSTTQNGEVVDKMIYINYADAATQIKAMDYLRDMDFGDLSDHMPIVVNFSYTSKVAVN
ncbi:MAG: hypothetical protein IJE11_01520, partial [Bacteroidales bacterium]|nr:hypothetical protein [Bacteroidales bacterium]